MEDFLDSLPVQDRADILAVFSDIKEYGFNAAGCQFSRIEGEFWQIKIRTHGGGFRFFYVMLCTTWIYGLRQHRKKGQKAPRREIEVARMRLKEVLE